MDTDTSPWTECRNEAPQGVIFLQLFSSRRRLFPRDTFFTGVASQGLRDLLALASINISLPYPFLAVLARQALAILVLFNFQIYVVQFY